MSVLEATAQRPRRTSFLLAPGLGCALLVLVPRATFAAEPERPPQPPPSAVTPADDSAELTAPTVIEPSTSEPTQAQVQARTSSQLTRSIFTIGGAYLQQLQVAGSQGDGRLSLLVNPPALVDLFLNIEPMPSLRGYVLTRFAFDPVTLLKQPPQLLLDQLWMRGEVLGQVFITVGRQQLKWGSGAVWNPTDFLRKLNPAPLEIVDLRTGTDMVRIHVPVEALRSNFYAIGFVDEQGPAPNPLTYGGALRAEVVVGNGEVSATAAFQQQRRPRYGLDANFGVGPIDVYGEVALLQDAPKRLWQLGDGGFEPRSFPGLAVQASAGALTRVRLADLYQVSFQLELFYNSLGYTDRRFLGWIASTGDYQPLYFGREYGMFQVTVTKRSPFEPALEFTLLADPRDASYLSRLDFRIASAIGVSFGAFVEVPLGALGSEFRFTPDASTGTVTPVGLTLFRSGVYGRVQY